MEKNSYKPSFSKNDVTLRILHVDDDSGFLDTSKQILEMDEKIKVTSVNSVNKAIDLLTNQDFDVVVSDYQMPEKDGLTFLAQLRNDDNITPFILFTGKGREDVAIKALNLGADRYVNKIGAPETVYGELIYSIKQLAKKSYVEHLLEKNEERIKKIASQTKGMLYQFKMRPDGSYCVPFCTDAVVDIFGCTPEDVRDDFSPIQNTLFKEDKDHVLESIVTSAKKLERWTSEFRVKLPGKPIKWIFGSSQPEKLSDGSIIWHGYLFDISDQKEVAEKVYTQQKMLEAVTENTKSGLSVISKDFDILYANKVLTDVFGDIVGKKCYSTFGYGKSICANCGVKEVFDSGKNQVVHDRVVKDRDGNDVYLNLIASAIRDDDGEITSATEISLNVTKDKIREKKLATQKKQFENLLESLPEVVFECDLKGNLVYVNSKAFKLFGYSKDDFVKGLNVIEMISPKDRSRAKSNIVKILRGEFTQIHKYLAQRKDGSVLEVLINSRPIFSDGKIVGLRGILVDNTKRHEFERNLLLKSKMLDSVDDAIITTEPDGKIVYWNQAAERLFGWKSEEVLGKNVCDVTVPQVEQEKASFIMKTLREGKSWKGEFEVQRKDGSSFLGAVVNSSVLDKNGNLVAIIGSTRDLTKKKLKASMLKESEEKFRTLAEQSPNMIFINKGGRIVYANKKCEELTGFSKDEFYDSDFDFIELISKKDRKKIMENFQKHFKGENVPPVEYSFISKNGSIIEGVLSTSLIPFQGEKAILGTINDFTDYKRAERNIEIMVENLQRLNKKLNIVGRLTRHDIRNKLVVILNSVYLAKLKLPKDEVKIRSHLLSVENAIGQINRFLSFSKVYQQLGSKKLERVDVGEAFDGAVSSFLSDNKLFVVNDCKGLAVVADSLLETLFYNLVENSLKHGKKVSSVSLRWVDLGEELVIVYEDNGVGICEEEKERIFDEGYGLGTGLGLFLIRSMCDVYGWSIKETGVFGKGAQFSIRMPKRLVWDPNFLQKV